MPEIQALALSEAGGPLAPFSYDPGPLGDEQVEIAVEYCGICHSDVAMMDNHWGFSRYPMVPGHEVIGTVTAVGKAAKFVEVGHRVGLGWNSGSCMHCASCMTGDHNMCSSLQQTIVGRHGGFASSVRCHWSWASPIPEALDAAKAGPLLCGGITVFNPLVQFDVRPTHRVGVIGIGGLGHLALQFMNKWGCHVTAFTSSASKAEEARKMGAHQVIDTHSADGLKKARKSMDFILSTVDVKLNWEAYLGVLGPRGRLHVVGIMPEPIAVSAFSLLSGQRAVSGSPSGSPATVATMLDFCARHSIGPVVEEFPMSRANEAIEHLKAGKARYRVVLKNDLA